MNRERTSGRAQVLCAVLVLLAAAADAQPTDVVRRTFPAVGGTLTVDVDFGSITVRPSDDDQVHVVVERTLKADAAAPGSVDDLELRFEPSGKGLRIEADYAGEVPGDLSRLPLRASFEVAVPASWQVGLETGGGNVTVDRLGGAVELSTRGGNIAIEDTSGSVSGFTSGGHVEVRDALGETVARTAGGHVTARLSVQPRNDYRLVTAGGHVDLYLADGLAVDVDAVTGGGRVTSELTPGVSTTGGATLREALGGGGPNLVLRTSGGNILIHRME
jgi:hypothetical protein